MGGRPPARALLLLCFPLMVTSEIYSSMALLKNLYESTGGILQVVDGYIEKEEARLEMLRSARAGLSTLQKMSVDGGLSLPEHPIGAYQIIKRLSFLNEAVRQGKDNSKGFKTEVGRPGLPTSNDHTGAVSALLRLQLIYRLPTEDLMAGRVKGHQTGQLDARDAHAIAEYARTQDKYRHLTVEWLKAAYAAHVTSPDQSGLDDKTLLLNITHAYAQVPDVPNTWVYINKAKQLYPEDEEVGSLFSQIQEEVAEMTLPGMDLSQVDDRPVNPHDWWQNYTALCRADPDAIASGPTTSFCTLTPGPTPFVPVKTEVLSVQPFIAIFYDVLDSTDTADFREEAFNALYPAHVGEPGKGFVSEMRVGQLAWLYDKNPKIHRISQRVMEITGLDATMRDNLSSSEPFQVVNYGVGGHYEPHMDVYPTRDALLTVPEFIRNTGERLATFLFYLDDVAEGGATVFPRAGVRVPPVKNGAAFWYNLLRSGDNDPLTLHAACPVLLGQKWVANKWIREYGNEFRHNCGSSPGAVHHEFPKHGWTLNRPPHHERSVDVTE